VTADGNSLQPSVCDSAVVGAAENFDRVGEVGGDGLEGLDGAFGTARKIDDQGLVADHRNAAGQNGGGGFLDTFSTDFLGEPGDGALRDIQGGFGSVVAGTEASAASGKQDVDMARIADGAKLAADGGLFVGTQESRCNLPSELAAALDEGRARTVFAFTARNGIGDCENGNAHRGLIGFDGVAIGFVHQTHGLHQEASGAASGGVGR